VASMSHHQQFRNYISNKPSESDLLRVCRAYKTATDNYAFELNGRLKGGLRLDHYIEDIKLLRQLICARLTYSLTVYRMTSDTEFHGSVLAVLEGAFIYSAFMSTSCRSSNLNGFVPSSGRPILLEIECPPGIAFAPLDLFPGTEEGEYLLGHGTKFKLVQRSLVNGIAIQDILPGSRLQELTIIKLQAVANPPYVNSLNMVTLTGPA
jgi:ADP-ribosyltransferase exoenzyme